MTGNVCTGSISIESTMPTVSDSPMESGNAYPMQNGESFIQQKQFNQANSSQDQQNKTISHKIGRIDEKDQTTQQADASVPALSEMLTKTQNSPSPKYEAQSTIQSVAPEQRQIKRERSSSIISNCSIASIIEDKSKYSPTERKLLILNTSMRNEIKKLRHQLETHNARNTQMEKSLADAMEQIRVLESTLEEKNSILNNAVHIVQESDSRPNDDTNCTSGCSKSNHEGHTEVQNKMQLEKSKDNIDNRGQNTSTSSTISTQKSLGKSLIDTFSNENTKNVASSKLGNLPTFHASLKHLKRKAQRMHKELNEIRSLVQNWNEDNGEYHERTRADFERILQQQSNEKTKEDLIYKELSGYLIKRGEKVKSWKRRWFTFNKNLTFSYYLGSGSKKPIKTFDVSNGMFEIYPDPSQKMDFAFKIVTENRIFYISTSSNEEQVRWIHFLKRWKEVNTR